MVGNHRIMFINATHGLHYLHSWGVKGEDPWLSAIADGVFEARNDRTGLNAPMGLAVMTPTGLGVGCITEHSGF